VSGVVPVLDLARDGQPTVVASKVCIDERGAVDSVAVLTRIDAAPREALARAIRTWRYQPVSDGGAAIPACFVTTLRFMAK
jgi:hypothetical protein